MVSLTTTVSQRIRGARRSTIAAVLAGVVLAAVAVSVLTSGASGGTAERAAQPFSLARLGSPAAQVALAQDTGRPVIVNFFASWCTACRAETPLLARFYRAHHGRVLIIGVDSNDHDSAAALRFLREHGVTYPVGYDPSASVAVAYGVQALPQTFFLNAGHQIVRHVTGAVTRAELTAWAAGLPGEGGAG